MRTVQISENGEVGVTLGPAFFKNIIIKTKTQPQIYLVMSKELRVVQHSTHIESPRSLKYKFHFKI